MITTFKGWVYRGNTTSTRGDIMASGHRLKTLTEEERETLEKDKECVSQFKREKLEMEAKKNWDLFYKRNSTHFFKDRHWITRECIELQQQNVCVISRDIQMY